MQQVILFIDPTCSSLYDKTSKMRRVFHQSISRIDNSFKSTSHRCPWSLEFPRTRVPSHSNSTTLKRGRTSPKVHN